MEWFWFIIVGAIAGVLAKMIMPGDKMEPAGCLMTILLGIGGALLMGMLIVPLFKIDPNNSMIASIVGATIGAIILIFLGRLLQGRAPRA
ncbi:MAG: GlsB/YeaQ/YmgE family stress response membrane protein [Armatimonadota bacterium]|nr:GlsB/YeaQ/YmgE family stress response membrane protein [Armatimonadota bacterium]